MHIHLYYIFHMHVCTYVLYCTVLCIAKSEKLVSPCPRPRGPEQGNFTPNKTSVIVTSQLIMPRKGGGGGRETKAIVVVVAVTQWMRLFTYFKGGRCYSGIALVDNLGRKCGLHTYNVICTYLHTINSQCTQWQRWMDGRTGRGYVDCSPAASLMLVLVCCVALPPPLSL